MSGFKNFILKSNLIEVSVGLIMALSFASVVTAFTAWLTNLLPGGFDRVFGDTELGDLGHFLNALIAFVIMGAVVYFFVVVPYTRAKAKFFPTEATGPTDNELLTEIRDALRARS